MRKNHVVIVLICLAFVLIIFFFRESTVIKPFISFFQSVVIDSRAAIFATSVKDESKIIEENRRLKEKLSEFEILERENIALRSQFEENLDVPFELIPARIVGFRGRGVYESFVVDVGENNGIKKGTAVIVGNSLVGIIHKVSQNISEVRTILHPEFSTIVKYPSTNARGIIRGFNSYLIMENVLITDRLEKGGIILTMGELDQDGIGIPSDLSVGKIDSVERVETASFQTAQIEPMVDYSQISNVFVISSL